MACASSQLRERIQGLPPEARTLMTDTLGAMVNQRSPRPQTAEAIMEGLRRPTRQGWSEAAAAGLFQAEAGKDRSAWTPKADTVGKGQRLGDQDDGVVNAESGANQLSLFGNLSCLLGCPTYLQNWGYFCTWWTDEGVGDADPEASDLWIIGKAWNQMLDNIGIIVAFAARQMVFWPETGTCLVTRVLGGNCVYDRVHLWDADLSGSNDANGLSIPGLPDIWLNWKRLAAAYNSRMAASCGDGDGECECVVAELAGTILHEMAHTCGGSEIYSHLLSHYYRYLFAKGNRYTHANCCAQDMPPSFDVEDYSSEADVLQYVCYANTDDTDLNDMRFTCPSNC